MNTGTRLLIGVAAVYLIYRFVTKKTSVEANIAQPKPAIPKQAASVSIVDKIGKTPVKVQDFVKIQQSRQLIPHLDQAANKTYIRSAIAAGTVKEYDENTVFDIKNYPDGTVVSKNGSYSILRYS